MVICPTLCLSFLGTLLYPLALRSSLLGTWNLALCLGPLLLRFRFGRPAFTLARSRMKPVFCRIFGHDHRGGFEIE
jgi:hypothetical protein